MAEYAHAYHLDFGQVVRMPDKEGLNALSVSVIERARAAMQGYPHAKLKERSIRFIWREKGDRHLIGRIEIDWGGKSRPTTGMVARDGKPIRRGS